MMDGREIFEAPNELAAMRRLLDQIRARLRHAGLRPTRQRVALGCLLFGQANRHISAEDLHAEALARGLRMSRATVYNTLHCFAHAALLRTVVVEGSRTYFDTNTSNHYHFLVQGEGELIDIVGDIRTEGLPPPPPGTEITTVDIVVRVRRALPHRH
jgi:Fur family transcriptional regulator, iron response regulator